MRDIKKLKQLFFEQLNERQKRLYAGLEALEKGHSGVPETSTLFSLHANTVRQGKKHVQGLENTKLEKGQIRTPGGGRKKNSDQTP